MIRTMILRSTATNATFGTCLWDGSVRNRLVDSAKLLREFVYKPESAGPTHFNEGIECSH